MKALINSKYYIPLYAAVLFLFCISPSLYAAYATLHSSISDYVPGEIIISFDPGITGSDVDDLAGEFNFSIIRKLRLRKHNKYLIKVEDDQSEEDLIGQLIQNADVLHTELNAIIRIPESWNPSPVIERYDMPTDDGGQIIMEYLFQKKSVLKN